MAMPPVFELRDVYFEYDGIPALHSLSVQIAEGESVALLGANGSGKSTLLRILDALYFPSRGQVCFSGQPLTPEALHQEAFVLSFRRRVALVFQNPDVQLFNPTVFDEVAFGPLQMAWSKQEVLLLDEPTSTLDPRSQSQVIDLIQEWKGSSKTVITATHQLEIVDDIASRVLVLEEGRVGATGTPAEVLANYELLLRANLVHAHRHSHGTITHSHPHLHSHSKHEHKHEP